MDHRSDSYCFSCKTNANVKFLYCSECKRSCFLDGGQIRKDYKVNRPKLKEAVKLGYLNVYHTSDSFERNNHVRYILTQTGAEFCDWIK